MTTCAMSSQGLTCVQFLRKYDIQPHSLQAQLSIYIMQQALEQALR